MSRKTSRKPRPAQAEATEANIEAAAPVEAPAVDTPVETEAPANRSVVPTAWVKAYAKNALKGTCGDDLAYKLDALTKTDGKADHTKIVALGRLNGIEVDLRWAGRNIGMQRMNLGNVLRGRAKRGETVVLA
jgi:hypothetical protein